MNNSLFEFDLLKSSLLRERRGIGFEEIVALIESGKLIVALPHPRQDKYPDQEIYVVDIGGYMWIVPYIRKCGVVRLITCYPSRKETKKFVYGEGEKNNEK